MNKNVEVITENNISSLLFEKSYQYFGLPNMPFQFEIGDLVVLKANATADGRLKSTVPGFKRSLGNKSNKIKYWNVKIKYLFQLDMTRGECLIPKMPKENCHQERYGLGNGYLELEKERFNELFNFTKLAEVRNGFL